MLVLFVFKFLFDIGVFFQFRVSVCLSQCFMCVLNYSCPLLNVILLSFWIVNSVYLTNLRNIFWKSCNNEKWLRSSVCVCDCDGKIRYYDGNVDEIQLS